MNEDALRRHARRAVVQREAERQGFHHQIEVRIRTNNDGVADKRTKLYTGLGINDTHAVINNLRWGLDGWIYATHGYSRGNVTSPDGSKVFGPDGSGVVRFKPDGSAFEQYSSRNGNTWGLDITWDGQVFWTQPTSGQLLMQTVLPEYALARGKIGNTPSYNVVEPSLKTFPLMSWEQMAYVQIDWVGSFTAAAGCAIYDGGTWPAEYNGDYFTTEPTINILHPARLTPQGSSYTFHKLPGREETEFIRSKDMWWRPIEVRVGPGDLGRVIGRRVAGGQGFIALRYQLRHRQGDVGRFGRRDDVSFA